MTVVKAPQHVLLYCRRCDKSHSFHLRSWGAKYYGDCVEQAMPESLLNQALGFEISIHTLLATYSSSVEKTYEELLLPRNLVLDKR